MSGESFQTVDVAQAELCRLHDHVARGNGRVILTRAGSDQACVLISKMELECLERALELLGDSDEVKDMCRTLGQLASATGAGSPLASM